MKTYSGLLLVSLALPSFACNYCECPFLFDVSIQNNTGTTCQLIQHTVGTGRFLNGATLEKELANISTISPGQKSKAFRFSDDIYYRHNIVLTYQCGDDKFVTLDSTRNAYAGIVMPLVGMWTIAIDGIVTAAANMDASYQSDIGSCTKFNPSLRPSAITWTLY